MATTANVAPKASTETPSLDPPTTAKDVPVRTEELVSKSPEIRILRSVSSVLPEEPDLAVSFARTDTSEIRWESSGRFAPARSVTAITTLTPTPSEIVIGRPDSVFGVSTTR
jgi:hypothetical protein